LPQATFPPENSGQARQKTAGKHRQKTAGKLANVSQAG